MTRRKYACRIDGQAKFHGAIRMHQQQLNFVGNSVRTFTGTTASVGAGTGAAAGGGGGGGGGGPAMPMPPGAAAKAGTGIIGNTEEN
uniref:Uncharacterized protein n=1 Tax=Romanomermis culicivorax TaxID=13658 RepID=A0A915J991_ROMCU